MKGKVLAFVLALALVSSLFLFIAMKSNQEINTNYEDSRSLEIRRSDLELELKNLEEDYDVKINGIAHNYVIFTDFDPAYYDEIVDKMDEGLYKGHLVISEQNFPNESGYLSLDQFNSLMKKGWDYCILYESSDQFNRTRKLMELNGMKCNTVYFADGVYEDYMDEYLGNYGYNVVVHHGEANVDLYLDDSGKNILHIACEGVMGDSPRFKLIDSVEHKGDFAFTIGFKNEEELYSKRVLESLINEFMIYEKNEELEVATFEAGYAYRMSVRNDQVRMLQEYESKKAELEQKIKEIDQQLEEKENANK